MEISESVVLVTGANRGTGAECVRELRERGAARIYAAARGSRTIEAADGVEPIALDITHHARIAAVIKRANPTCRSSSTARASSPRSRSSSATCP
ncbi:SDR family NAD(P)-dependent oxidoreductase [Streptomyces tauricus]|uniref:SDR family NAD(P)-dependent oxidoreductase n=1 Tax=Streptomyces tauricus TaxID=68274 RepID=A0ABZ1JPZ3_9ACTN|nr:SDR family NAD(P)-dependent oxidoreductase [Streptomyces tauricus]